MFQLRHRQADIHINDTIHSTSHIVFYTPIWPYTFCSHARNIPQLVVALEMIEALKSINFFFKL